MVKFKSYIFHKPSVNVFVCVLGGGHRQPVQTEIIHRKSGGWSCCSLLLNLLIKILTIISNDLTLNCEAYCGHFLIKFDTFVKV